MNKINYYKIWNSTRICFPQSNKKIFIMVENNSENKPDIPVLLEARLIKPLKWLILQHYNNQIALEYGIKNNECLPENCSVVFWRSAE